MWRSGPAPPGLCGGCRAPPHRGSDGGSAGLPGPAHRGSDGGSAGLPGPAHRGSTSGSAGLPDSARRRFYRALGQSVTARPVRADSVAASARRSASMASAIEVGGVLPSATASMKAVSSRR